MWYSMMYLPLAEATVITFLGPMLSGYMCHVLLRDPFTRKEQLASLVALAGVVLIARPTFLFGASTPPTIPVDSAGNSNQTIPLSSPHNVTGEAKHDEPTPAQRLLAILVALIGVLGAAGAFTTIRYIGKRAHALITVTYFAVWSMLVSFAALLLAPLFGVGQDEPPIISFAGIIPSSGYEWFLLISLGMCGFLLQFMMTAGIAGEKSNRATAMVYTHMLFAAGFDRWVFGHYMGVFSLLGCGLIVGSALWAALAKKEAPRGENAGKMDGNGDVERGEEVEPMLGGVEGSESEEDGLREVGGTRSSQARR